ncbi:MAG: inositol monophosphatase family protein, partial [Planctomycetota bacterium]|nr:inositol monophosphatase family protein [Planctomycetota bacterium]
TGLLAPRPVGRDTSIFVDSRFHKRFTLDPAFPGKVRSLGTTVGHLAYVAAGCADAAVLHDVHVWDFAAGLAMLNEAGGVMRYLDDGTDVAVADYLAGEDAVRLMIAGHAETVARLAKLIASRE